MLGSLLVILLFFSTVTTIASASRQTWAFSRDQVRSNTKAVHAYALTIVIGLSILRLDPASPSRMGYSNQLGTFSNVSAVIFANATSQLLVCLAVSLILSAINFGSDIAFNAILSVSNAALIFSYIISVGCIRLKRFRGEPLLPGRWSLGKWGGPINDITLAFLLVGFVFSFFPEAPSVGDPAWAADFNWAIVIFGATVILASGYFWFGGRHKYVAPVALVKRE